MSVIFDESVVDRKWYNITHLFSRPSMYSEMVQWTDYKTPQQKKMYSTLRTFWDFRRFVRTPQITPF